MSLGTFLNNQCDVDSHASILLYLAYTCTCIDIGSMHPIVFVQNCNQFTLCSLPKTRAVYAHGHGHNLKQLTDSHSFLI